MIRVLVTGGRNFADRKRVYLVLDNIHAERTIAMVIHGAARGADTLAREWAWDRKIPMSPYPARWDLHGRSAGPIRNQQMLDESKPQLVVAFPGGVGTADMVRRADRHGIPVEFG